jgi:hypothetical protein
MRALSCLCLGLTLGCCARAEGDPKPAPERSREPRAAGAGQNGSLAIRLDPAWHAAGAVAFAQRSDRRIVASAVLRRDAPPARPRAP